MMRVTLPAIWLIVCGAVCAIPSSLVAQQKPEFHDTEHKALMNQVWETFDLLMYKVGKKNGKTTYTPYFPAKLAALDKKKVKLQGYMIPLRSGFRHNSFMVSVLPIHQCMFCGTNGIPAMVEVNLADGRKEKLKEQPITITGIVRLNATDKTRTEILLVDSHIETSSK